MAMTSRTVSLDLVRGRATYTLDDGPEPTVTVEIDGAIVLTEVGENARKLYRAAAEEAERGFG
jgi:hypothetical protein